MTGPQADAVSATQAAAAVQLVHEAEISKRTVEERASLVDAVIDVPWCRNDREVVLNAALAAQSNDNPSKGVGKGRGSRRQQQRYFHVYWPISHTVSGKHCWARELLQL